jgi:excisionase family DNA binding protein
MNNHIFTNDDIDTDAAHDFFTVGYDFDPLPGTPDRLTLKEAAFILDVSVPTVQRLVQQGILPIARLDTEAGHSLFGDENTKPQNQPLVFHKSDVLHLVFSQFLVNFPLDLPDSCPKQPEKPRKKPQN